MSFTEAQIEWLQELINALPPGVYDAMDIIPKKHREYFDTPTKHGPAFKKAVRSPGVFKNIEHMPPVEGGNNHQRYKLHGG